MDLTSIRDSFGECENTLLKLLGLEISATRFEGIRYESCSSYDHFHEKKDPCAPESEGEIHAAGSDGGIDGWGVEFMEHGWEGTERL